MSSPKVIHVKEDAQTLRNLLKSSSLFLSPRVKMLLELKKNEDRGISKRELATLIGVNHNSIQTWRSMYLKGGLDLLLSHKKIGYKPTIITSQQREGLEKKLKDPTNGLRGYKELLRWVETEFGNNMEYNTLYKYCVREFGSSIKVARKSHIKKDVQAGDTFKKTSDKSVARQSKAKPANTKA